MGSTYNPLNAPSYIAGTLTLSAGTVAFLIDLIKAQLEPNCPGAALMVNLTSDTDAVYVGASNRIAGALSAANYGYKLDGGGSSYKCSTGAGNSAPIADIQLLCASQATLHVEIFS